MGAWLRGPGRALQEPQHSWLQGRRWQPGATTTNARLWTSGECVLRRPLEGPAWGIMRKQPNQALRRGAWQPRRWAVRREGEQAAQDTIPFRQGEGDPESCHSTHLEDFSIRAMAQTAKPLETLLEEGLWPVWVITGAPQGLRGFATERHPPRLGLVPARGPRREEAADRDAALGRGPGWEALTEPPGPLEGEARFCMAEVGWDWDGGATQGWRGALCGHRHGQHRRL